MVKNAYWMALALFAAPMAHVQADDTTNAANARATLQKEHADAEARRKKDLADAQRDKQKAEANARADAEKANAKAAHSKAKADHKAARRTARHAKRSSTDKRMTTHDGRTAVDAPATTTR